MRPLLFQSVEELENKIQEYFDICDNHTEKVLTKSGDIVDMPSPKPYTISGLAYHLGTNRQTLLNYEDRPEYFDTIRKAKAKIETFVEESLWKPKIASGVIFNLKNNFNWIEKSEVQQSGETTHNINTNDLSKYSVEELKQLEQILSKDTES